MRFLCTRGGAARRRPHKTGLSAGLLLVGLTAAWRGGNALPAPLQEPASSAPLQSGPVAIAKGSQLPIILPLQFWNGVTVLQGMVSSGQTESFVLNTGMNACAISPAGYARMQLPAQPSRARIDVLDRSVEGTEARMQSIAFGPLKVENVAMVVADVLHVLSPGAMRPDAPVGWLGSPFLSAFQVTFDFSGRALHLDPPTANLPSGKEASVMKFTLRDGRPFVRVSVPGVKPFSALVDTGTRGCLLPSEVAEKLKLQPLQVFTVARPGKADAKAALVVLPKLKVENVEAENVRAIVLAPGEEKDAAPQLAVLGTDFLSRFRLTINYAKKRLALTPLLASRSDMPPVDGEDGPAPDER